MFKDISFHLNKVFINKRCDDILKCPPFTRRINQVIEQKIQDFG